MEVNIKQNKYKLRLMEVKRDNPFVPTAAQRFT